MHDNPASAKFCNNCGANLIAVNDRLSIAEKGGEHAWDSELYRLKGELLQIRESDESEAEECFNKALSVARLQQASSWELRAAVSQCDCGKSSKKFTKQEQQVYNRFTEGHDSEYIRKAKALLSELENGTLDRTC